MDLLLSLFTSVVCVPAEPTRGSGLPHHSRPRWAGPAESSRPARTLSWTRASQHAPSLLPLRGAEPGRAGGAPGAERWSAGGGMTGWGPGGGPREPLAASALYKHSAAPLAGRTRTVCAHTLARCSREEDRASPEPPGSYSPSPPGASVILDLYFLETRLLEVLQTSRLHFWFRD